MKTSLLIEDSLFREAKKEAEKQRRERAHEAVTASKMANEYLQVILSFV